MKIKLCTDINQSKKLAEILPIESADMHYNNASIKGINYVDEYRAELMDYNTAQKVLSKYLINPMFGIIPCWSLASLLSVLPYPYIEQNYKGKWTCRVEHRNTTYLWEDSNPVDACVAMVEKLNELNLL